MADKEEKQKQTSRPGFRAQAQAESITHRHKQAGHARSRETDRRLSQIDADLAQMRSRLRALEAADASELGSKSPSPAAAAPAEAAKPAHTSTTEHEETEERLAAARPAASAALDTKAQYDVQREADQLLASLNTLGSPKSPAKSAAGGPDQQQQQEFKLHDPVFDVSDIDFSQPGAEAGAASPETDLLAELSSLPDLDMLDEDLDLAGVPGLDGEDGLSLLGALTQLDEIATPAAPLVRDHYAAEDRNEAGLRRGKKQPVLSKGGRPTYEMEDAHLEAYPFDRKAQQALFCVFDGFAGKECAQDAAVALPRVLAEELARRGGADKHADLGDVWPAVYAATDKALSAHEYVGCTCTTLFVWQHAGARYVQAANVGDSSAFLYRDGRALMLNVEHKVTSDAERERVARMGNPLPPGARRINGIAVARALGTHFVKELNLGIVSEPFVSPALELGPGDKFAVIASDGVWDVISGQAACELIEHEPTAADMAYKLVRHAVSCRGCLDNVTVVVVCF